MTQVPVNEKRVLLTYTRRAVRICKNAEPASSSRPAISASRRFLRSAYGSGFAMHMGWSCSQYSITAAYSLSTVTLSSLRLTSISSVSFLSLFLYLAAVVFSVVAILLSWVSLKEDKVTVDKEYA